MSLVVIGSNGSTGCGEQTLDDLKEISMAIEWAPEGHESDMTMEVRDNSLGETYVLAANATFNVAVRWEIPAPLRTLLGGSFLLRVYAESIGPGQEIQIGTFTQPVTPPAPDYNVIIPIPGGMLLGEGAVFGGVPVSGVYKLVTVLQHQNPGATPTQVSGYAESGSLLQMRTP